MNIPPWNPSIRVSKPPERLSKEGAERTAREIVHVWRCHGYQNVQAIVEPVTYHSGRGPAETLYCVRTNLVGGLPPRVTD